MKPYLILLLTILLACNIALCQNECRGVGSPIPPFVMDGFGIQHQVFCIDTNANVQTTAYFVTNATGIQTVSNVASPSIQVADVPGNGTLAFNTTFSYVVTATNSIGETLPSQEISATTSNNSSNTHAVSVAWTPVAGATGYNVYGRTKGSEQLMQLLTGYTNNSFIDTGAVTPTPTTIPPTKNTSGGIKFPDGSIIRSFLPPPNSPEGFLQWNPSSIAANSCVRNTINLTGARASTSATAPTNAGGAGDFVAPAWPSDIPNNITKDMYVSGSDVITVQLCNPTISVINFTKSLMFGAKLVR